AARLGLREIEAGPPGFLPADPREAGAVLERHGVRVIGGFVTAVLPPPEPLDAELESVQRPAAGLSALRSEAPVLAAAIGRDADGALAAAVRERRVPYAAAVAKGLYLPLGDGDARIADVLAALKASGYTGWGVLEQDIALAGPPTEASDPARAVALSRDFARA